MIFFFRWRSRLYSIWEQEIYPLKKNYWITIFLHFNKVGKRSRFMHRIASSPDHNWAACTTPARSAFADLPNILLTIFNSGFGVVST